MKLFNSKKEIGTIEIRFFGDEFSTVSYKTQITDKEEIEHNKSELFVMYYAKMLYNLGKSKVADTLIDDVYKTTVGVNQKAIFKNKNDNTHAIVKSGVKRINTLPKNLKLVKERSKELDEFMYKVVSESSAQKEKLQKTVVRNVKLYKGILYNKSDGSLAIKTEMSHGEEDYYAPLSVFVFLQHLINDLSEETLSYLMVVLQFMKQYYQEVKGYSDLNSIIGAPDYGFEMAGQFFGE